MKQGFKSTILLLSFFMIFYSVYARGEEEYSFVPISGDPHDVVYDSVREVAYVSNRSLNQIDLINIDTLTVIDSIHVSSSPRGLAITPDNSQLMVTLYNTEQMSFIGLDTKNETSVINLPPGRDRNYPLRVDFDSFNTCLWRDGGPGNPYGYMYSMNLSTLISTRLLPGGDDLKYSCSYDGSLVLLMFDYAQVAIWDSQTQSVGSIVNMNGDFGSGWSDWICQGAISNDGQTIMMIRGGYDTLIPDFPYEVVQKK